MEYPYSEWVSEVAQLCPTLCDPMDCSLAGSSIHGIFQARILEWVAISFSRGSSQPRDQTQVSHIVGRRFTVWATREVRVEGMIFRKDEWALRRTDGKYDSLWQSCLSVKWTSSFLFCDKSQPPIVDETPKEDINDRRVHFAGSVLRKSRQVRESLFLLFSQVPLLSKIINIP